MQVFKMVYQQYLKNGLSNKQKVSENFEGGVELNQNTPFSCGLVVRVVVALVVMAIIEFA